MAKFEPPAKPVGGNFIGKEEKAELLADGTALPVIDVVLAAGYNNKGMAYYVKVDLDGEERTLSFTASDGDPYSRDVFFDELISYLRSDDAEPVSIRMVGVSGSKYVDVEVAE